MLKTLRVWWNVHRLESNDDGSRQAAVRALAILGDAATDRLIPAFLTKDVHTQRVLAEALGNLGDARAVEPLIGALEHPDLGLRRAAAEALGTLKDKRAFDPLIRALQDRNVRDVAAAALVKLKDARTVERLMQALRDANGGMRYAAAEVLGILGDARAVDMLIQTLGDINGGVRRAAAAALAKLGEPNWTDRVRGDQEDMKRLGESGDTRAIEPLIKSLGVADGGVRCAAAAALQTLGDARAIEPLIRALGDADGSVRGTAAKALGRLGDTRAIEPLIRALGDADGSVRGTAAEALGRLGDTRAIEPLIRALRDANDGVRRAAMVALAKLGSARAIEPLIQALWDADGGVRSTVAKAIGDLGDVRAIEPLKQLLADPDPDVRRSIASALVKLGERHWIHWVKGDPGDIERLGCSNDTRAVEPLVRALENSNLSNSAATALGNLGDVRAVEPLLRALRHAARGTRRSAAEALGMLGDVRAVGPLIEALNGSERNVRRAAAAALGKLGDTRAVEPLIRALGDSDRDLRRIAVAALGSLGDARAVAPLKRALEDSDHDLRRIAAHALEMLGDALKRALEGSDRELQTIAADGLAMLDEAGVIELLISHLRDAGSRETLADKVVKLGAAPRAVKPLFGALANANADVRRGAAAALAKLGEPDWAGLVSDEKACLRRLGDRGDPRVVEPLIKALRGDMRDKDIRGTAAEALGKLGDARAVGPLINALGDCDGSVRCAVADALSSLGEPKWATVVDGSVSDFHRLGTSADDRTVGPLIDALENSDQSVRIAAAEFLGRRRDSRAVEPLIKVLSDCHSSVRRAAIEALGNLGDSRAVASLTNVLKDSEKPCRIAATEALGKLGDERAVTPLSRLLRDTDISVQNAAADALKMLSGAGAAEAFIQWLGDGKLDVPLSSAHALRILGNAESVDALILTLIRRVSMGTFDVQLFAVKCLGRLGRLDDVRVIKALFDARARRPRDDDVRAAVAAALAEFDTAKAVDPLIDVLIHYRHFGDDEMRRFAAEELRAIAGRKSDLLRNRRNHAAAQELAASICRQLSGALNSAVSFVRNLSREYLQDQRAGADFEALIGVVTRYLMHTGIVVYEYDLDEYNGDCNQGNKKYEERGFLLVDIPDERSEKRSQETTTGGWESHTNLISASLGKVWLLESGKLLNVRTTHYRQDKTVSGTGYYRIESSWGSEQRPFSCNEFMSLPQDCIVGAIKRICDSLIVILNPVCGISDERQASINWLCEKSGQG